MQCNCEATGGTMKVRQGDVMMEMCFDTITPDEAELMLELYDYDGQRNIRPTNLTFLKSEMEKAVFRPWTIITIVEEEGRSYISDGRHRLRAVVASGKAQCFWILTIRGAAVEDVYTVQDIGASRSMMDHLRALKTTEQSPLPVIGKPSAVSAARTLSNPLTSSGLPKQNARDLARMYEEWVPYMARYGEVIFGGVMTQRMKGSTFVASAAVTLRYRPEEAAEFWRGIAFDDGLARHDPRKRIVDMLWDPDSTIRVSFGSNSIRTYRILAYYWNKFLQGQEVKRVPGEYPDRFMFDGTGWGYAVGKGGD